MMHTTAPIRGFLNRDRPSPGVGSALRRLLDADGRAIRRNLLAADCVLACSNQVAMLQSGYFRVHPDRMRVLPHAFHPDADAIAPAEPPPRHPRTPTFLIVGNVEYLKGFDLICAGLAALRRRAVVATLSIAGTRGWDDPNIQVQTLLRTPAVQDLLRVAGRESLRFLGRLEKAALAAERAASAAVIIGSRYEAFTMVAGECALAGDPMIVSDRTGWVRLMERFQSGRLVDPYDASDLADAMQEMLDPVRRNHWAAGSRRLGEYLTSPELHAKTVAVYRALCEGRG
jgi:glycosyltransferase involved in cell wall biosynthesis